MSLCQKRNCSDSSVNVYKESDAYVPLYFSYAAYCEASNLNDWNCKWCHQASDNFTIENVITTNYLQCFIGYDLNENSIVISFRGTHNYHDWFKDLRYKQRPYPKVDNAYVHQGFYNAYTELHNAGIATSLQNLFSSYPQTTNILITGHSMGAALSELCALHLIDNDIIRNDININVYTFGGPRWANKHLAEYFNSLSNIQSNWRIVNKDDPIAIVPGQFLGSYGYQHTATQVLYTHIYKDLQFVVCDGTGEDPNCGYSLWTEETNAHLWYLNVHEDCGMDTGHRPYREAVSIGSGQQNDPANGEPNDSNEYGANFSVNYTHWELSLLLICGGFVIAAIYYLSVKLFQKRNGYTRIEVATMEGVTNAKKNEKKTIMTTSLLHDVTDSN